jgi:hypothetical protein
LNDENAQQQEALLLRRVQEKIDVHALPPMVIGSGRGNLAMKFHSFVDLARLSSQLISITTDQGGEFGITHLEPIEISILFPWAEQVRDGRGDDDDHMFAPLANAAPPPSIDLTGCVGIAGLLHIIHNSSAYLGAVLATYKDTVQKLKHVANLIRRQATKDRLQNSCFNEGPSFYIRRELVKFDGKVYENRWGTVAHCTVKMLKFERCLRFGWDLQKYGNNQHDNPDIQNEAWFSNSELVDSAIQSELWWNLLRTFSFVAKVLIDCWVWAEMCQYHGDLDWEAASPKLRKAWALCPLRGKRAPCLAMRECSDRLQTLAATASVDLLVELSPRLTDADRTLCLQEFENARTHLAFVCSLRLSHWKAPPWMIFGCAHSNVTVARAQLMRCLDVASLHPLFLRLQIEVAAEATAWADGEEELAELPLLGEFLGALRFAHTADRAIEGEHAKVSDITYISKFVTK